MELVLGRSLGLQEQSSTAALLLLPPSLPGLTLGASGESKALDVAWEKRELCAFKLL